MRLLNWTFLISFVMLSTVVLVTDSCSSFSSWKSRSDIVSTTPNFEMTIETTTDERCPEEFGKEYCHNGGVCLIKQTMEGPKPHCICKKPYDGIQCMEKSLDGVYYKTNQNRTVKANVNETLSTNSVRSTNKSDGERCSKDFGRDYCHNGGDCFVVQGEKFLEPRCECKEPYYGVQCIEKNDIPPRTIDEDSRKNHPCPQPYDVDFCIHGKCFAIIFVSSPHYFCECFPPYYGERCDQKGLDGYYGSGIIHHPKKRKRRHLTFNATRKNPAFHRFRAKTLFAP